MIFLKISEIDFLISKNLFFDIKNYFLISRFFLYQKIEFLISKNRIFDIKKSFFDIRKYLKNIKTAPPTSQRVAHYCKRSPFFFRLIPRSTEKYQIYFLSFNFHFISTKKSVFLTLINAGLFQSFDVVEIHMTSQYSFPVDAKITSIF